MTVSVIIPAYNRADTIVDCINSVLRQTYSGIEVIVVDDASTDNTIEKAQSIKDSRVHIFTYEQNRGACYARNYGIDKSNGEFLAFQDSDDIWHPDKIQKEMDYLIRTDADLVFCGMNRIDDTKSIYFPPMPLNCKSSIIQQLLQENRISTQTILMRKKVASVVKFDESFKRFQDWDFSLQVALHGFKIEYLPEALVDSFIQENSISKTAKTAQAYEHLFSKYAWLYDKNSVAKAHILMCQARGYRGISKRKTTNLLIQSFRLQPSAKTFVKILLSLVSLWK